MQPHRLDPIALVTGVLTVAAGTIALMHQAGWFHLGPGPVAMISCLVLGFAGVVLTLLWNRRTSDRSLDEQPG